jgi:26S proteasome regulatory subunit N6
LFESISKIPGINDIIISLCNHVIEWSNKEGRTFLRYKIETKLAETYFREGRLKDALALLKDLLFAIKKLEDKQMLVEIQLIEAKVFHGLENLPKSKASLTSVKTASNSIYVAPALQADIDLMSGILSADEKDFNTAFSYFYEAFEGYNALKDDTSKRAFKYMLMAKIMNSLNDDALSLINSSVALKLQSREVEAMKEVAIANKEHKLIKFEKCKLTYDKELLEDPILRHHIELLYNTLLEANLKKII